MERFGQIVARAALEGNRLVGYAAVFNEPTSRQRDYTGTETIARTAFDGLLTDTSDVVALVNHDASQMLGRTASGTLRLHTDDHGLGFELDLPDTQLGRDVRVLVERGDLRGMSFSAAVGDVERTTGGVTHRSFKQLVDVSIVGSPAYPQTSVAVRSEAVNALALREQTLRARARLLERH